MAKIIIFIILIFAQAASAVEFSGARASGVGGAFGAFNGDLSCLYSNPAGINGIEAPELGLTVGSLYKNNALCSVNGMVFAWPWQHMSLNKTAVHWNNYSSGGNSVQEIGFTASTKKEISGYTNRLGATLKWRNDTFVNTSSIMMDIGAQADFVPDKFTGGVMIQNFMSSDNKLADSGVSLSGLYHSPYGRVFSDLKWHTDRFYVSGGFEKDLFYGLLVPRIGFLSAPESYFTAGFSSHLWPVGFDVSYAWPSESSQGSGIFNMFMRYRFGGREFSEVYLDRSIDKAAYLGYEIQQLEAKKSRLAKEIITLESFKKNPDVDIESLPGVSEELNKKTVPKREPEKQSPVHVKIAETKQISWPQYHKVVPGDTLRSIAEKYYGDPNKWQAVYAANPNKIERGQPRLGEELVIPKL